MAALLANILHTVSGLMHYVVSDYIDVDSHDGQTTAFIGNAEGGIFDVITDIALQINDMVQPSQQKVNTLQTLTLELDKQLRESRTIEMALHAELRHLIDQNERLDASREVYIQKYDECGNQLNKLEVTFSGLQSQLEDRKDEVKKLHGLASDLDWQLTESRQSEIILNGELEQLGERNERLETSLGSYKQKYDASMEQTSQLEEMFSGLQGQLEESKIEDHGKSEVLEHLRSQLVSLAKDLEEKKVVLSETEIVVEKLTIELTHQNLTSAYEKITELDGTITGLREELRIAQQETTFSDERVRKYQDDLSIYKKTHSRSNKDVIATEEKACQLELENEELRVELKRSNHDVSVLQDNLTRLWTEITSLNDSDISIEREDMPQKQSYRREDEIPLCMLKC